MSDEDRMLAVAPGSFGSGVIGVCDICGRRQAVIVLAEERYKLCVLDFLNKSWIGSKATPGRPLPAYRSERFDFPTEFSPSGKGSAIVLSPTKEVRRPGVLVTPDIYGLTTTLLDAGIRMAKAGFEVLLPDLTKVDGLSPADHISLRTDLRFRGGVRLESPRVLRLVALYADALRFLRARPLADPEKVALFGAFYGAAFAIGLAGADRKTAAVALASPVAVRPPEYLRLVSAPVLVLGGERERAAAACAARWAPILAEAQTPFEVRLEPGAGPRYLARDLSGYTVGPAEESWRKLLAFLHTRLLPPPPKPPAPRTVPAPVAPAVAPTGPPKVEAPSHLPTAAPG
ncbi:MAG: dienelactone hydrolase family protein [Thermoplasmata archaeon]|nr:dienelactone hydrolase family protein [Thermoplasmata archaeon]